MRKSFLHYHRAWPSQPCLNSDVWGRLGPFSWQPRGADPSPEAARRVHVRESELLKCLDHQNHELCSVFYFPAIAPTPVLCLIKSDSLISGPLWEPSRKACLHLGFSGHKDQSPCFLEARVAVAIKSPVKGQWGQTHFMVT